MIVLLGSPPHAFADTKPAFSAEKKLPIDEMPALMIPVDFDKDGNVDILVHSTSEEFEWLENQKDGTFTKHVIDAKFTTGGIEGYMTYGDIDGDGDLDVIASSDNGTVGSLSWFENLGGGKKFAQHVIQKDGQGYVAVGDMDGDHKLDVVFAAGDHVVYFSNADGKGKKWGPAHEILDHNLKQITVADFTKDGLPDVLGYRNDNLVLLTNQGSSWPLTVVKSGVDFTKSNYKVVDLDRDGFLDIVFDSGWKIELITNAKGKTFTARKATPEVTTRAYYGVDAADLDGDGDIDLVVTGGVQASWWENVGGKFEEHVIKTYEQTMSGAAFAVDLDGDGKPDFISKRWGAGATFVWYPSAGAPAGKSPVQKKRP